MIDPKTKLPISDTNGSHPDLVFTHIFNENVPKHTILLVPPVTLIEDLNVFTDEVKQYFSYDEKSSRVITNIKTTDGDEG